MNERVMQFRVGVVALTTLIICGLLVTLNAPLPSGWIPWLSTTYPVNIELPRAPGIAPNTPVHKNGLLIGRVGSVKDLDDRVVVEANIDDGRKLFPQYDCKVQTTMLGDSTIEFISAPVPVGTQPLGPGATVSGSVEDNPLEAIGKLQGDVTKTIDSLGRAGDEVAKMAQTVNRAFGEEGEDRMDHLVDQAEIALQDLSRAMRSMDELPETIHDARVMMQDARGSIDGLGRVAASAERNLKNLEGLTGPLGEKGEGIAEVFVGSVDSLDNLIEEVTLLVNALNSREGTLGQLIHSRELYDDARQLLVNTNYVVVRINDLAARLRPVVEDARVFMDKIAREPGRLVGGAFNKGPGIK